MSDVLEFLRGDPLDGPAHPKRRAADEIERLRGALSQIVAIENQEYGGDWDEIEQAREIARMALRNLSCSAT